LSEYRIIIAECDYIFRFVLNNFFQNASEFRIIAETRGIDETLEKSLQLNPDILLSDFSLISEDKNIITLIKRVYPTTIIGLLLPNDFTAYQDRASFLGADFAIPKENIIEKLIPFIKEALKNRETELSSLRFNNN
jgi:DNA-binding NarL/FixJ family response regulator